MGSRDSGSLEISHLPTPLPDIGLGVPQKGIVHRGRRTIWFSVAGDPPTSVKASLYQVI